MTVKVLVSTTEREMERLVSGGPRRDVLELAAGIPAVVRHSEFAGHPGGVLGRLLGGHVRQAWKESGEARRGDTLFADGEHVGLPLTLFLALRGKRRHTTVVMLGHFVTRWWKAPILWLASRMYPRGTLLVHSVRQARTARPWLSSAWPLRVVPYQVDTHFWSPRARADETRPLVISVGSENRDYQTFAAALDGVDADVVIAAGSHWARRIARRDGISSAIQFLSAPLNFRQLRDLYARADLVVVPLKDVSNQSGVSVILEAMSMGVPVVVTATEGQRECVAGPLMRADGSVDRLATADRGPWVVSEAARGKPRRDNGYYVPPGDGPALRAAVLRLLADRQLTREMGCAGRDYARSCFDTSHMVGAIAPFLRAGGAP